MKRLCFLILAMLVMTRPSILAQGGSESASSAAITPMGNDGQMPVPACPRCHGKGTIPCVAQGCENGKVECPGKCLKKNRGRWEKMKVAGHGPNELWQTFRGRKGTQSWTQAHVGQVIEMQKGEPVNVGRCPICQGTTKVNCKTCHGTEQTTCPLCHGTMVAPVHPVMAVKPRVLTTPPPRPRASPPVASPRVVSAAPQPPTKRDVIRTQDGSRLEGTIVVQDSDVTWIRTLDGHRVEVKTSTIVP